MDLAQRLGEGVPIFVEVNGVGRKALRGSDVSIVDRNGNGRMWNLLFEEAESCHGCGS